MADKHVNDFLITLAGELDWDALLNISECCSSSSLSEDAFQPPLASKEECTFVSHPEIHILQDGPSPLPLTRAAQNCGGCNAEVNDKWNALGSQLSTSMGPNDSPCSSNSAMSASLSHIAELHPAMVDRNQAIETGPSWMTLDAIRVEQQPAHITRPGGNTEPLHFSNSFDARDISRLSHPVTISTIGTSCLSIKGSALGHTTAHNHLSPILGVIPRPDFLPLHIPSGYQKAPSAQEQHLLIGEHISKYVKARDITLFPSSSRVSSTSYSCTRCDGRHLRDINIVRRHIKYIHLLVEVVCPECYTVCRRHDLLTRHVREVHSAEHNILAWIRSKEGRAEAADWEVQRIDRVQGNEALAYREEGQIEEKGTQGN